MTPGPAITLFGLLLGIAFPISAATPAIGSHCDRKQAADVDRADPAICLRRTGIEASASPPENAANALFERAERSIAAGRFAEAEAALDCADATLGDRGDPLARYELVRRRGILDYRRERIPQALSRFECALQLSRAREDRTAIARDLKNVGTSLRRLGDYPGALAALAESLRLLRANGGETGAVLHNIADLYREQGERAEAQRYYDEAHAAFRAKGDAVEAAHVLESMSVMALDGGDAAQAQRWLQTALQDYRAAGNVPYQLRVYAGLARAALARGEPAVAAGHSGAGLALAESRGLPVPAALQLQAARIDRLQGRPRAAQARLGTALAALPENDADRAPLLEELANAQDAQGDRVAALATLREAREVESALARALYDRQLGWLRSRFEAAERERTIAALEHQNQRRAAALRQRTLLLWAIAGSALAALLGLWLLLQRRQHRHRLAAAAQEARHEQALARYRREAEALAEDRSLLQSLLDSRADAVCLLDTEGQVLAVNRAACALLGIDGDGAAGRLLPAMLPDGDGAALSAALERMDDVDQQTASLRGRDGELQVELGPWEQGDGLVLMNLRARAEATTPEPVPPPSPPPMPGVAKEARADFRQALVELMLAALEAWERGSGLNRIELAERSKLWRVHIDDGRLRTRALERYLNVARLPRNPRWRDVVRTAYFVLGECRLDPHVRDGLQRRIDAVLAYTRRSALV
ncbi:MAG: tetratricopeptide repeat protein [Pseudomonadota bacterium]